MPIVGQIARTDAHGHTTVLRNMHRHRLACRARTMVAVVALHIVSTACAHIERFISTDNIGSCCAFSPLVRTCSAGCQRRALARTNTRFTRDGDIHRPARRGEANRCAVGSSLAVRSVGTHAVGRVRQKTRQRFGEAARETASPRHIRTVGARDVRIRAGAPTEAVACNRRTAVGGHFASHRSGRMGYTVPIY